MKSTPVEPSYHHRWWKPFDLAWLEPHPLFIGYMEDKAEDGLESRELRIEYPYKAGVVEVLERDGLHFAPYKATLVNSIVDNEPGKTLVFTYGVRLL